MAMARGPDGRNRISTVKGLTGWWGKCVPGKGLQEEKMVQPLVVENFMRVVGTHVSKLKVAIISKKSNEIEFCLSSAK